MPKREELLVFGAPLIGEEEKAEVLDCLASGWLGTGPKIARFEEAFGAYQDGATAVAVSSCTAALHLSLLASGIEPGDEVITTPHALRIGEQTVSLPLSAGLTDRDVEDVVEAVRRVLSA